MKALADPSLALADGLAAIRTEFQVAGAFPAAVLREAETASQRMPTDHADRTATRFVTLDPASSTDLDQAFAIEVNGADLLLHYAIADVDWFVDDGSEIDQEAWRRGETLYLPDGKVGLYPPILSEGVASLLPSGPRPAIIFTVRVGGDGEVELAGVERALIHSKAKLAYDSVQVSDLPNEFGELTRRILAAEERRGSARVDPPEQEVVALENGEYGLAFRPRLASEASNAALSLAANLAIARALYASQTGLFRVMAEPDAQAVVRLRHTAKALNIVWPDAVPLGSFERTLDQYDARHAALMLAIRRAGPGASYEPYRDGAVPWHAAMAATYVHATAPLRRLADRYVIRAAMAVANGRPVPGIVKEAFAKLPAVMARADALAGRLDRAVLDLAEAMTLTGKQGESYPAIVIETDDRGARIQLRDLPVVARLAAAGVAPGEAIDVRLTAVDAKSRSVTFERASSAK